ncbi:MAG: RNA polymerase-binding protein RpbA [Aeromonas veronii]
MFDIKTDTIFETSNKIRNGWVGMLAGTLTEVKLKSHPREMRFELYAEIDKDVRNEYIKLMAEYNDKQRELGNYSTRAIIGRRVLNKNAQVNCDDFLYQAVINVVGRVEDEMNFYKEPEQLAA